MPARTLKRAREQEVDVRLLQLELAGVLEAFDERVLELQLADEPDAVAEAVRDEQHEAMEVEPAVLEARACCSGSPCSRTGRWCGRPAGPPAGPGPARPRTRRRVHRRAGPGVKREQICEM